MRRYFWRLILAGGLIACGSEQKVEQTKAAVVSQGGGSPLNLGAVVVMVPEGWQSQPDGNQPRRAIWAILDKYPGKLVERSSIRPSGARHKSGRFRV